LSNLRRGWVEKYPFRLRAYERAHKLKLAQEKAAKMANAIAGAFEKDPALTAAFVPPIHAESSSEDDSSSSSDSGSGGEDGIGGDDSGSGGGTQLVLQGPQPRVDHVANTADERASPKIDLNTDEEAVG
jgi:hypothetical protein